MWYKPFSLLLFCLVMVVPEALGDKTVGPHSYTTFSASGRYVFVMLAPEAKYDDNVQPESDRVEAVRVRSKYPKSGLYLDDNATTPLWTVDWYAHQVFLPSDGIHLVRSGPWASDSSNEALTFYESGRETRSYKVGDLVDCTWFLPHTTSHFSWVKTIALHDAERTLELTTEYNDRYKFDFVTGKVVYSCRKSRVVAVGALLTFSSLVLLSAVFLKRRSRRRQKTRTG